MSDIWLPLEANPDVMNTYVKEIGAGDECHFCDVMSLDEELLSLVPRPVVAVLLLYPLTDNVVTSQVEESRKIEEEGQYVNKKLYFMQQIVPNACGTIAILHAVGNNRDSVTISPDSFLDEFFHNTVGRGRTEIGESLSQSKNIAAVHESHANEGQSDVPDPEFPVYMHFVCFVCMDNVLYELDGRKLHPVNHGPSTSDSLLEDCGKVIRDKFMALEPDDVRFSIVAYCKD